MHQPCVVHNVRDRVDDSVVDLLGQAEVRLGEVCFEHVDAVHDIVIWGNACAILEQRLPLSSARFLLVIPAVQAHDACHLGAS